MAEDKAEAREMTWRQLLPWTELFRGFQIALDINKLFLAAAGIFAMALGWWLLALVFRAPYKETPPRPGDGQYSSDLSKPEDWDGFKKARDEWNLMYQTAGIGAPGKLYEPEDLANDEEELKLLKKLTSDKEGRRPRIDADTVLQGLLKLDKNKNADFNALKLKAEFVAARYGTTKPSYDLATWPWSEDRGPNPYLLVTGQAGRENLWEPGHFWEWFATKQLPVMVEPLIKIVRPIIFSFSPRASIYDRVYFFLVTIWTFGVWSIFGGAITRIAAVQVARGERIGMGEAIRFTSKRLISYLAAPIFPLVLVVLLLIFTTFFGIFFMIPIFGDILVAGLFWPVTLMIGLIMGVTLLGLAVGWPLMAPTISAEGTDSWEAVSRSFSYVFQRPWQYIWYALVSVSYGAIVVFFIGLMGSLTVFLSKWTVSQTLGIDYAGRQPTFLFIYAPESFGWRDLLLQGANIDGQEVVQNGHVDETAYKKYIGQEEVKPEEKRKQLWLPNKIGAAMVAFWLGLVFLLLLGFGYSFFWTEATIIYMLMRRSVDSAEMDEVYLEEDDQEGAFGTVPPPPAPAAAAKPAGPSLTMVEPPALRPTPPSSLAPVPPPPTPVAAPAPIPLPPVAPTPPAPVPAPVREPEKPKPLLTSSPPEPPPASGNLTKDGESKPAPDKKEEGEKPE